MALKIEKPGRREEYTLGADRESSQPTVFELRPLSWEEMAEMQELSPLTLDQSLRITAIVAAAKAAARALTQDDLKRIEEIAPTDGTRLKKLTQQHALAVRYGITGIRGLVDLNGDPTEMGGPEFARQAPATVLHELGAEIVRISRLAEDRIKK